MWTDVFNRLAGVAVSFGLTDNAKVELIGPDDLFYFKKAKFLFLVIFDNLP